MPSEPQEGARGQHGRLAETLVPAGLRQLLGGGWELGSWVLQAAWKTSGSVKNKSEAPKQLFQRNI